MTMVSVVVPVFDEEDCLGELVDRTLAACRGAGLDFELILVDDGSSDASPEMMRRAAAEHAELRAVLLNRNYGQHAAVTAGLAESRGEVVVTLDADLQNPPEEIPRLVATMEQGFDVVGSVRVPREDSWFRRTGSAITNLIVQRTTGVRMHDYGCMLRAYSRPVVDAMLLCHERSTFIPVLANRFAHRTTEIEVRHEPRRQGVSKYPLGQLVRLQFDLLTSMSAFPLRLVTLGGLLLAALGFAFGVALLVARLVLGAAWAAEGVFTLFAVLFLLVGAQLVGLGLVGEYIARIYDDVRARPRYFVREVVTGAPPASTAEPPPETAPSPETAPRLRVATQHARAGHAGREPSS